MRLAKYLAQCGLGSRREASRIIEAKRIAINGQIASHIHNINVDSSGNCLDNITLDGKTITPPQDLSYWLLNKPVGIDCRLLAHDSASLIHLLPKDLRLYPAGRLDKDSHGLLLLSNDGALTHRLMHPSFAHTKTYHVSVDKEINADFIAHMARGVHYKDVLTLPCICTQLNSNRFEIVLTQGLNRQIRRMSQALGYRVIDLQRVAIMELTLGNLAQGQMRQISLDEINSLKAQRQALALSA